MKPIKNKYYDKNPLNDKIRNKICSWVLYHYSNGSWLVPTTVAYSLNIDINLVRLAFNEFEREGLLTEPTIVPKDGEAIVGIDKYSAFIYDNEWYIGYIDPISKLFCT